MMKFLIYTIIINQNKLINKGAMKMLDMMMVADAKQKELKAEIRNARKADWFQSLFKKQEKVENQMKKTTKNEMVCCV